MPSLYEGFGLTLIEAMNHGLPIVCTNVDSLPELMEHYDNGFSLPWAEFMGAIEKATKLEKVQGCSPFTADNMVESYLSIYTQLIDRLA